MKKAILFLILCFPLSGYGQYVQFTKDSIPLVNGKVEFQIPFELNLTNIVFHQKVDDYLNKQLHPYSGGFIRDNDQHVLCKVTDYLKVTEGFLQEFGVYMIYRLDFSFQPGRCIMTIDDLSFLEKGYFEASEKAKDSLLVPQWTGKDILIDHQYHLMFIKKTSEKITTASLKKINQMIKDLYQLFESASKTPF